MILAITFDLYGTLAGFQPSRYEIQSAACDGLGVQLTPEGVLRGYALADAYMAEQSAVRPLRTRDSDGRRQFFAEYERLVLSGAGVEVTSDQAAEIWSRVRAQSYELTRFEDVLPAFDMLKGQGLTLGMISNMNTPGDELSQNLGLSPYLDFAVTSGEVGVEKPHPKIFQEALSRACVEPHEAMHVGDQLSSDIEGARAVGMSPVLMDRDGNHPDFTDVPRVESLVDLLPLVSGV